MQLRFYSVILAGASMLMAGSAVLAQRPLRERVITLAQNVLGTPSADDAATYTVEALSSQDFANRIGVNTHIHYTDGGYADVPKTIDALRYLGVRNLRDSVPDPSLPGGGGYNFDKFADQGFKFDFVVSPSLPLSKTLSLLETFARAHPHAIAAVEGPNEVNNWPVSYKGETGSKAAVDYQADLYAAIKDNPLLSALPVYNLTSWPELIGKSDVYNAHSYPPKGEQPEDHVKNVVRQLHKLDHLKSAVITEVGYYTLPGKGTWGGVDDATQAKLSLNLILDSIGMGISRVYLYQLLDAYPDPSNNEMEKHFGLFDIDYRPKPAASAIHNLLQTVAANDPATPGAKRATPSLTVSAGDLNVKRLLLDGDQKVSTLILWDERKIWDSEKNAPLPVPASEVTVDSDAEIAKIDVIDPIKATEPVQTVRKARSVKVQLEGYPVLIKLQRE